MGGFGVRRTLRGGGAASPSAAVVRSTGRPPRSRTSGPGARRVGAASGASSVVPPHP
ncbi:hypothetical protein [Streptomyces sp. NRRL WC-3549]|uniref:hypothetical protein n=1 Tax=Streptomyces sp. NRRL WC-3549 TaxID=1463925 RepID=UPI000A5B5421|nr:hypothetical protein [Streptomyces sp. NRRL WC-3549]